MPDGSKTTTRSRGRGTTATYRALFARHSESTSAQDLLMAALEVFATQGFHGSTTRDIAKRAKMSPAAVYVHFKAKSELLFTIARLVASDMQEALQAAEAVPEPPSEKLARLVRTQVSRHAAMRTAVHVANFEFEALSPRQRAEVVVIRDATEAAFLRCLQAGQESGAFRIPDLGMTKIAIVSLGVSVSRWFHPGGRLTPDALGDLYATLVLRMVGAAEAPTAPTPPTAPTSRRRAPASRRRAPAPG